jgi:hypothetical protein
MAQVHPGARSGGRDLDWPGLGVAQRHVRLRTYWVGNCNKGSFSSEINTFLLSRMVTGVTLHNK